MYIYAHTQHSYMKTWIYANKRGETGKAHMCSMPRTFIRAHMHARCDTFAHAHLQHDGKTALWLACANKHEAAAAELMEATKLAGALDVQVGHEAWWGAREV